MLRSALRAGDSAGHAFFLFCVCLLLAGSIVSTSCSSEPPAGVPIDFEALNSLRPFSLRSLDGQVFTNNDVLSKATLVAFFFPT